MDKNSLDYIYNKFSKDVYYYLLSLCKDKYIAEDIMQDVFYKAYLYFEVCPYSNIKSWLFTVAKNCYIDYIRKNKKNILKESKYFDEIHSEKDIEKEIINKNEVKDTYKVLEKLSVKQRKAIILCDFKELSYKESAIIMNISLNYFKVLLFRARKAVRENMKGSEKSER